MNYSRIACITCSVEFPAGIAVGSSSSLNFTEIDRNGKGELLVRGTAIAGVIRHEYLSRFGSDETDELFGKALDTRKGDGKRSCICFFDAILDTGKCPSVEERTHNSIDRHWGRVTKHALFSFACCPPGTSANLMIEIHGDNQEEILEDTSRIISILSDGIILGGNSNRGIGLTKVSGNPNSKIFEMQDIEQHAEYLDSKRHWKQDCNNFPREFLPLELDKNTNNTLKIQVDLKIPEGQDILVADGSGSMEPQRVTAADGKEYWRLPGSSLRGVVKAFITNLAAREGEKVAYSIEQMRKHDEEEIAERNGWLFHKPAEGDERKAELHEKYPVASLFGSLHAAGRLYISDAYIPLTDNGDQERIHVSVDTITGGAIESMLFSNKVLTSQGCPAGTCFSTQIIISDPQKREIRWLTSAIKAIDCGYLRIGSSKASGRLTLSNIPIAEGVRSDEFDTIWRELSDG